MSTEKNRQLKMYVGWYPSPRDPDYWKWFDIDGLMISLGSLSKRSLIKTLIQGIHRFIGYYGEIFVDSGGFQFALGYTRAMSQIAVLNLQKWIGANKAAHLDYPYVGWIKELPYDWKRFYLDLTINNASVAKSWSKKNDDMDIVYIIQGWNLNSFRYCAKRMAKIKAEYYGIGSLHKKTPNEIAKIVQTIRNIIGKKPKLHLFAASSLNKLKMIAKHIDSVDSATSGISGAMKEVFLPNTIIRRHIDAISSWNGCSCPICKKNPLDILLIGKSGKKRDYNAYRKIHNTYWLIKALKNL